MSTEETALPPEIDIPERPTADPSSTVAVCLKAHFMESMDYAARMVEWMETLVALRVDKVLLDCVAIRAPGAIVWK